MSKNIISIVLFATCWLSLVDKAFEWQGDKFVGILCDYSNKKQMPDNQQLMNAAGLYAYSPIFTKFVYKPETEAPTSFEDIQLGYYDLWGNFKVYCHADGKWETQGKLR